MLFNTLQCKGQCPPEKDPAPVSAVLVRPWGRQEHSLAGRWEGGSVSKCL